MDLGGHAAEALWTVLRSGKGHIGDGTCNAAIAISEWVNSDEP
jgi:hypothetical protein